MKIPVKCGKYSKLIHKIAHFLKQTEIISKTKCSVDLMPLLYFFFKYGKIYNKEKYSDFSFELLEYTLAKELSITEDRYNPYHHGVGWSLMEFVKEEFLESDDLDKILEVFDTSVLNNTNNMCSMEFKSNRTLELVTLGLYLKERTSLVINDEAKRLELKQHFFMILYELSNNLNEIFAEGDIVKPICEVFLLECYSKSVASVFLGEIFNHKIISKNSNAYKTIERKVLKTQNTLLKLVENNSKKISKVEANTLATNGTSMIRKSKNLTISSFELFNQAFFNLTL